MCVQNARLGSSLRMFIFFGFLVRPKKVNVKILIQILKNFGVGGLILFFISGYPVWLYGRPRSFEVLCDFCLQRYIGN